MLDRSIEAELEHAADGPITIDLTTIGRRSGQRRRIEIWLVNVGGRLVIGGTPGERDWLANVRADPAAVIHLKEGITADLPATASEVTDPALRREIYGHRSTRWYRSQTTVDDLVANGPTIELALHPEQSKVGGVRRS